MTKADELQKRVDTLQNHLRIAGDHLKRLAAENESLTEQVEKLTERESENTKAASLETKALKDECDASHAKIAQLEAQIAESAENQHSHTNGAGDAQRLHEWEEAARECVRELGILTENSDNVAEGPAIFGAIKSHIESALSSKDSGYEGDATEDLTAELAQLRLDFEKERDTKTSLESAVSQALENIESLGPVPDTLPESIHSGFERILNDRRSALEACSRIDELETQLQDAKEQARDAAEAREELSRDYDLLLERIGTMKDALKAKMNAESDELKRLRKELSDSKAATSSAVAQKDKTIRSLETSQKKIQRELDDTKRVLWECQELASRAQSELTDTTSESDRLVSELRTKLKIAEEHLRSESSLREQLEDRVEQLQNDFNNALNSESQWVGEREVHLVTIQNLQSALESLQESKDAEVDMAVERLREELRSCTKEQRAAVARAEKAETRLRKIELTGTSAEQTQQKINSQQTEIERLRHEVAVLKDHLNESMRRLREESSEFNLDKRVITNLIVGFLALPYGDSKRYEVLQLMSSILQFTEEQQQKVGLIRKAGRRVPLQQSSSPQPGTPISEAADTPPAQLETKDSFSDQWISYLLRESSGNRNRRS
ncbi:hypothetical protein GGI15_004323 [Coemansia interrupta]|uniref:GRIP domain-containing protein n=1 Tax=Coemansia interrupta TaxID=1126814 RepID=A0A9W8H3Q9_9FUNG|nr:hypothetical protein GGI15_004323 [Coemansia interrupta]